MQTSNRTRRRGAFALVFAATALVLGVPIGIPPVGADGDPIITVTFPALFQEDSLAAEASLEDSCDETVTAEDIAFVFNGEPTTAVTASDFADGGFLFSVPDSLATEPAPAELFLDISVTCDVSGTPTTQQATIGWAQIQVSKTVVGDGPAGAAFPMAVDCESSLGDVTSFEFDLADGESWSVFAVTAGGCAVEELDDLGALSSTVTPEFAEITSSSLFPVEVTNTFPEAPPTPEPTPEPAPEVTPAFTG